MPLDVELHDLIYEAVRRRTQQFKFQVVNPPGPASESPGSGSPDRRSPASRFLVTDHLYKLLVPVSTEGSREAFPSKLTSLHTRIFHPFKKWVVHVDLLQKPLAEQFFGRAQGEGSLPSKEQIRQMLSNLALYFLIWTEAANVRHCPEVLFWIFWVCACSASTYDQQPVSKERAAADAEANAKSNHAEADLSWWRALSSGAPALTDQYMFSEQVVAPIFDFLVEEVLVKGREGSVAQDIANRTTYDDVNESFCLPHVVARAVQNLGFKVSPMRTAALLSNTVNPVDSTAASRADRTSGAYTTLHDGCDRHATLYASLCAKASNPGVLLGDESSEKEAVWYAVIGVFNKTFVERRWLFAIFRSFFRVVSFHVLLFHFLVTLCWSREFKYVSTVVLSHAGLVLLYRLFDTHLHHFSGERPGRKRLAIGGVFLSIVLTGVVNAVMWVLYVGHMWTNYYGWGWLRWARGQENRTAGRFFESGDVWSPWLVAVLVYVAAVLLRFVCSFMSWRIARVLSPVLTPFGVGKGSLDAYMMPAKNLTLPISSLLLNALFWTATLGIKGVFDYYAIVQPLREPVQLIRVAFQGSGRSGAPWWVFAAIMRCAPGFVASLFDTGIFYSVVAAVSGVVKGYLWQNLGWVTSFEGIRRNFGDAPRHFVKKMHPSRKSAGALDKGIDRTQVTASEPDAGAAGHIFARAWTKIVQDLFDHDHLSSSERAALFYLDVSEDVAAPTAAAKVPPRLERRMQNAVIKKLQKSIHGTMRPIFCMAGLVERAARIPHISSHQKEVLEELFKWTVWLLYVCGAIDNLQAQLLEFRPLENVRTPQDQDKRAKAFGTLTKVMRSVLDLLKWKLGKQSDCRKISEALAKEVAKLLEWYNDETKLAATGGTWWQRLFGCGCRGGQSDVENQNGPSRRTAQEIRETLGDQSAGRQKAELKGRRSEHELDFWEAVYKVADHIDKALGNTLADVSPKSHFATQTLAFFVQSLCDAGLPQARSLDQLPSLTTLVPHYEEDVLCSMSVSHVASKLDLDPAAVAEQDMSHLTSRIDDGDASTITYLRSIHRPDWICFLERLKAQLGPAWPSQIDISDASEADFDVGGALGPGTDVPGRDMSFELMRWASNRGQVLSRTIEGMACYGKAAEFYAKEAGMLPEEAKEWAQHRFSLIVASQVYGRDKSERNPKGQWRAWCTDRMLEEHHEWLRIAYLDQPKSSAHQYSVLLQHVKERGNVELYRIRLPRNKDDEGKERKAGVVLGEGKPENQNHAMIFVMSEIVQGIDMNQAGNFAEALKLPNLLSEFAPSPGLGKLTRKQTALVGFREYIFSEDGGAPAQFAASTEWTFGTIVQRVMAMPGNVRFHYGHPDMWNKIFVMTRGGVSKATRGLHVSEDVFGGYNHVLRGGEFKYREYHQVGKGRDTGFDSINAFESKVAGGNGEQMISREVYRLGSRMDFFRLLSYYHTGPGFFINSALIMLGVYLTVWVLLLFTVTRRQDFVIGGDTIELTTSGVQLAQLGMLGVIMFFAESSLERGVIRTAGLLVSQILSGSWMFFIFRARTSAYYFMADLLYGGAKYIGTGRGHAIKRVSFVKLYTLYARSHMYWGVELMMLLWLLWATGCQQYWASTWGPWLVVASILLAPIWFNPDAFSLDGVKKDYNAWQTWMLDLHDKESNSSWFSWHEGQMQSKRKLDLRCFHLAGNAVFDLLANVPTAFISVAALRWGLQRHVCGSDVLCNTWAIWGIFSGALLVVGSVAFALFRLTENRRRSRRALLVVTTLGVVACVVVYYAIYKDRSRSRGQNFWLWVFVDIQVCIIAVQVALWAECALRSWFKLNLWPLRNLVDGAYRVLDYALGYAYFAILFLLAFLRIPRLVQVALLFNVSYANSIVRGLLMKDWHISATVEQQIKKRKEEGLKRERDLRAGEKALVPEQYSGLKQRGGR